MAHCVAWGCNNQPKKNKEVSYHKLPSDKAIANSWIQNIKRTDLPNNAHLCSNHFEEKYFDKSHDLKRKLLPSEDKSRFRRKLLRGAIPSLFPHREPLKERESTKRREQNVERAKIINELLEETPDEIPEMPYFEDQLEIIETEEDRVNDYFRNNNLERDQVTEEDVAEALRQCDDDESGSESEEEAGGVDGVVLGEKIVELNESSVSEVGKVNKVVRVSGGMVDVESGGLGVNGVMKGEVLVELNEVEKVNEMVDDNGGKIVGESGGSGGNGAIEGEELVEFNVEKVNGVVGVNGGTLGGELGGLGVNGFKVGEEIVEWKENSLSEGEKVNGVVGVNGGTLGGESDGLGVNGFKVGEEIVEWEENSVNEGEKVDGVVGVNGGILGGESGGSGVSGVMLCKKIVKLNESEVEDEMSSVNNGMVSWDVGMLGGNSTMLEGAMWYESKEVIGEGARWNETNDVGVLDEVDEMYSEETSLTDDIVDSVVHNISKNSDFIPDYSEDSNDEEGLDGSFTERPIKDRIATERTFLVYEEQLYKLLRFCPQCGSLVDRSLIKEMKNNGSQLHLRFPCVKNCSVEWKSQPVVGTLKGVRNLFLACSLVFSGVRYAKFERLAWLLNLKMFSTTEFYNLKKNIISPVIRSKWKNERKRVVNVLRDRDSVVLISDGRHDNPGHCAKYCTYTIMDSESCEVVDTVVIPVTDVKNSFAMELAGFKKVIRRLIRDGVKIDIVSTDKHLQVQSILKNDPEFNFICHQYDPWHIIKGLVKKMTIFAKKKKAHLCLLEWIPSVINHFWWSVQTCGKDSDVLYERFSSIAYRVVDMHDWFGCTHFERCAHDDLSGSEVRSKKWLVEGSDAHQYLVSMVKNLKIKEDMRHLTECVLTLDVEVFNNLLTKYCPKQYHFELNHMETGAYLAALEHNFNSLRGQDVIKAGPEAGKLRYKVAWRKPLKKFVPRKVKSIKRYDHLKLMIASSYKRVDQGKKSIKSVKRSIMAPAKRESKDELIERSRKMIRFNY